MDGGESDRRGRGRPRKLMDEGDHAVLRAGALEGCGLRVMMNRVNAARRARGGEHAETVSHWRVLEELKAMGYASTPAGYTTERQEIPAPPVGGYDPIFGGNAPRAASHVRPTTPSPPEVAARNMEGKAGFPLANVVLVVGGLALTGWLLWLLWELWQEKTSPAPLVDPPEVPALPAAGPDGAPWSFDLAGNNRQIIQNTQAEP